MAPRRQTVVCVTAHAQHREMLDQVLTLFDITGNTFMGLKPVLAAEKINRELTGAIADLQFAPTDAARVNVLREGVDPATIFVTGNTVIDALLDVTQRLKTKPELSHPA